MQMTFLLSNGTIFSAVEIESRMIFVQKGPNGQRCVLRNNGNEVQSGHGNGYSSVMVASVMVPDTMGRRGGGAQLVVVMDTYCTLLGSTSHPLIGRSG